MNRVTEKVKHAFQKSHLMHKAATLVGKEPRPDRWIFVVGCYGSGTTLLAKMLAHHSQIDGLPLEGVYLTDSLPKPEDYGWTRAWVKCFDEVRLEPGKEMETVARRVKKQWSLWYSGENDNLIEKSVANTTRMPFLQSYFKPAYFIYIVRNGFAVSESIRRKANPSRWGNTVYENRYPIELCAEQWIQTDNIVEKDEVSIKRLKKIRYEDLVSNTTKIMSELESFIGLNKDKTIRSKKKWNVHGSISKVKNMNRRSINRLSRKDKNKIKKAAGQKLKEYNYV